MENITKLVDKYGPEISKSLGIASTQVSAKLLWYVRVSGVKDMILNIIFLFIGGGLIWLSHFLTIKILKKDGNVFDPEMYAIIMLLALAISFIAWLLVCLMVIAPIVSSAIQIVSPEYWVIDQVFKKLVTK